MTVKEIQDKTKELMTKSVSHCKTQLDKVRTGRASATLLDGVTIDYYGSPAPINQVAGVSVPDARTIIVQPFDPSTLSLIEKAIQVADLGFNPQNDGQILRIPVPPLTEDRRKEFVKMCKKYSEDGKIAITKILLKMKEKEVKKKSKKSLIVL